MISWQPIETAPKELGIPAAEWPLLYCPNHQSPIIIGRWVNFSDVHGGWESIYNHALYPTHWAKPEPPPPPATSLELCETALATILGLSDDMGTEEHQLLLERIAIEATGRLLNMGQRLDAD